MITHRFEFLFKPLRISKSIVNESNVSDIQSYDSETDTFAPDYTMDNLQMTPSITVIDDNGIIENGRINDKLYNISWSEVKDGVRRQISPIEEGYSIQADGFDAGKITVKKNISPTSPVTLEFSADYTDKTRNEVIHITLTKLLICGIYTKKAHLELDIPSQSFYDPIFDTAEIDINATLFIGNTAVGITDKRVRYRWEVFFNGEWIDAESLGSLGYAISVNGNKATLNRSLMGNEAQLRCRAIIKGGNEGRGRTGDAAPMASCSIVRRMPSYEYRIEGIPDEIPKDAKYITPRVAISCSKGIITDYSKYFFIYWGVSKNYDEKISSSFKRVAEGEMVSVPVGFMDKEYGGIISVDVVDRGAFIPVIDTSGYLYKDSDGILFLIK